MKKFLKISGIVFILIIILMIIIPIFFKAGIMRKAGEEINKAVYAKVDWKDFSISLIRGFPDLKVSMKGFSVVGINKFEGDTLAAFDEFSVNLNLVSILSGKIKVRSVFLNRPVMNAIVLADSSVNWDIVVPSDEQEPESGETDTSSSGMSIQLNNFEIREAKINYTDSLSDMTASISGLNLRLKGDFSEEFTSLDFMSSVASLTFTLDGLSYLKNARLDIRSLIDADLVKFNFTFSDNEIRLNDLRMGLEGSFGMPNDTDITMDIRFSARDTEFKSILSMVPAVYMQDFAGVKTSGTFSLEGTARGTYNEKQMPVVDAAVLVSDGYFSYPDLPKSVNNVNIDTKLLYDGVMEDNTKVDVNKFHLEIAGNPVDLRLHIITPMSDMQMNGALKAKIDLGSLADVVPLPDTKLAGIINMDLGFMGRMSDIENENYEAFKADGLLEVLGVILEGKDIPVPVSVSKLSMNFSPESVGLRTFDARLGNSDIHMDGMLENFLPYVFRNEVIRGKLNFKSNYLNISELMPESEVPAEVGETDTSALTIIEVPENIDFVLQTGIGELLYDQLRLENVLGRVTVKDGKVVMENLSMDLLGGSMVMSGEYNTRGLKSPKIDYKLDMKEIDIPSSFTAFNTVAMMAPIAEMMKGKVSARLSFSSLLDSSMYPVPASILGNGSLDTREVEIINSETFNRISQALRNDKFRDVNLKDIKTSFEINDGRLILKPFDAKIASTTVTIGGDQGIDQTMNYSMIFTIPRSEFGSAANDVFNSLVAQAASKGFDIRQSENVNINLRITGTFTDPKIGLDVKESLAQAKTEVKTLIQEKVSEEAGKQINTEVDKIMKDAEEEAVRIKAAAKDAGDKLIGEAELQGKNLIRDAGNNTLKKVAAERTADMMVKNATKQADALNKEAETRADALLQEARKKADALKK